MNEQSRPSSLSHSEGPPRSPPALLRVAPVVLLLLFCCCVSVQATWCSRQSPVYNFDQNRYKGLWYLNRRSFDTGSISAFLFERCHKEIYTILDNGLIDMSVTGVNLFGLPFSRNFKAKLANPSKQVALFTVQSNSIFPLDTNSVTKSNYRILDTDYETYSVVIGCRTFAGFEDVKGVWIMTREPNPPPSVVERALQVVTNRYLNFYTLRAVDQKKC